MPRALGPQTFRSRLAAFFGLLSLLVVLPTYFYVSEVHRDQLLEDRQQYLTALAVSGATVIAENLVERRREIELLSKTPLYRSAPLDSPEFRASLERLQQSYPYYSWIGLADLDGMVRAATADHLVGQSVAKRPWFMEGKAGVFVGDVHEALLLAQLLQAKDGQTLRFIDFASPVLDRAGKVRAVLASHAHWNWAGDMLQVVKPSNAAEMALDMFIVNRRNEVIFPEITTGPLRLPDPDRQAKGRGAVFHDWGDGALYLTASATIKDPVPSSPLGWRVVVRQREDTVIADMHALQRVILLVSGGAVALLLLLVWVGAGQMSRPLERLTRIARRIERGEERVMFEGEFASLELQRLSSALQGMYSTLAHQKDALAESNRVLETKVTERTAELQRLNEALEKLARTDTLTGVPNRLHVNERLEAEFVRFQRSHEPYAVLVLDIDFFKKVNDTHGHATGDAVLRHVAGVLRQSVRSIDLVGRTGGEEFMVILPMTDQAQAVVVAEKIRSAVAASPIEPVGRVTISVGVQEVGAGDASGDDAVVRADHWLYEAKNAGRNRVEPSLSATDG